LSIPEPKSRFIDEPIEVIFDSPPALEKSPPCPQGFNWRGETFRIVELLAEWKDFRRRGRMGRNMIPPHLSRSERIGSLGVGRFYFQVRTADGRIFELYYDRTIIAADDRKGRWVLLSEKASDSDKTQ